MNILEMDAGNSRLKWRLLNSDGRVAHGFLTNSDDWHQKLPVLLDQLGRIDCARASIVSGDERFALLSSAVDRHCHVSLVKAEVKPRWRGLRAAYPGLGVDRWLAMLAAHHMGRGVQKETEDKLVVSCGTAMTIDVLSGTGEHHGGYIVPGIGLMKRMLHSNTAQLPIVDAAATTTLPGKSSVDCINNGILAMATAMINEQLARCKVEGNGCAVYLTGGDATVLQPYLQGECSHHPELVMDGLALAFDEAEVVPG